jgi:hypothetical protein
MPGSDMFISSCSRRQLARRRWARAALRLELPIGLLALAASVGAFLAGRGGLL